MSSTLRDRTERRDLDQRILLAEIISVVQHNLLLPMKYGPRSVGRQEMLDYYVFGSVINVTAQLLNSHLETLVNMDELTPRRLRAFAEKLSR